MKSLGTSIVFLIAGCGMSVKVTPHGETRYPANPNKDLKFFASPFEGMEAVGVIEIEGANFDKYQDVRTRAGEEAAKLGADALVVVREIRQDGSYWQDTGKRYTIGSSVYAKYEKVAATYPVCVYIAVRQHQEK